MIKQHHISGSIQTYAPAIKLIYQTNDYVDPEQDCVFWGVYCQKDINLILKHQGKKIVIFTGGDILKINHSVLNKLNSLHSIAFVVSSQSLIDYLRGQGVTTPHCYHFNKPLIKYYNNLTPINRQLNLSRNGIYIYIGITNPLLYGHHIFSQLKKNLPQYQFHIFTNPKAIKRYYNQRQFVSKYGYPVRSTNNLISIFDQCFIGLSLTKFSGNGLGTVTELGYYGLRCVHNDDRPSSIKFPCHPEHFDQKMNDPNITKVVNYLIDVINKEFVIIKEKGLYQFNTAYDQYFGNSVEQILTLNQRL